MNSKFDFSKTLSIDINESIIVNTIFTSQGSDSILLFKTE